MHAIFVNSKPSGSVVQLSVRHLQTAAVGWANSKKRLPCKPERLYTVRVQAAKWQGKKKPRRRPKNMKHRETPALKNVTVEQQLYSEISNRMEKLYTTDCRKRFQHAVRMFELVNDELDAGLTLGEEKGRLLEESAAASFRTMAATNTNSCQTKDVIEFNMLELGVHMSDGTLRIIHTILEEFHKLNQQNHDKTTPLRINAYGVDDNPEWLFGGHYILQTTAAVADSGPLQGDSPDPYENGYLRGSESIPDPLFRRLSDNVALSYTPLLEVPSEGGERLQDMLKSTISHQRGLHLVMIDHEPTAYKRDLEFMIQEGMLEQYSTIYADNLVKDRAALGDFKAFMLENSGDRVSASQSLFTDMRLESVREPYNDAVLTAVYVGVGSSGAGGDYSEPEYTEAASEGIRVGARCQVEPGSRRGEVRFVGPARGGGLARGHWIGVQFDEPVGAHDGCVGGERYFECPAAYGGMERPVNVTVGDFPEIDAFASSSGSDDA